jgi:hypothetical protein
MRSICLLSACFAAIFDISATQRALDSETKTYIESEWATNADEGPGRSLAGKGADSDLTCANAAPTEAMCLSLRELSDVGSEKLTTWECVDSRLRAIATSRDISKRRVAIVLRGEAFRGHSVHGLARRGLSGLLRGEKRLQGPHLPQAVQDSAVLMQEIASASHVQNLIEPLERAMIQVDVFGAVMLEDGEEYTAELSSKLKLWYGPRLVTQASCTHEASTAAAYFKRVEQQAGSACNVTALRANAQGEEVFTHNQAHCVNAGYKLALQHAMTERVHYDYIAFWRWDSFVGEEVPFRQVSMGTWGDFAFTADWAALGRSRVSLKLCDPTD